MTNYTWLVLAGGALALAGFLLMWFAPSWRKLREYSRLCRTCGYLPDPPTPTALRRLRRFSRWLLWWQVGRVRVIGEENLKTPGPKLIAPNHGHSVDPAPFSLLLEEPARYMAAGGVFGFAGGLGALLAGPAGAFAADLTPGKGGPAREVGVRVLTSGQTLVMFPEGWAWMNGKVGEFKKGAVRIARDAAAQLGHNTYIVPVYMRYGAHPGDWILKFPPPLQYLIVFLLFPFYRRGLTIVVGQALASSELPADAAAATALLRQRVLALDPQARPPKPAQLRRLV